MEDLQTILSTSGIDVLHDVAGVVFIGDGILRLQPEDELQATACGLRRLGLLHQTRTAVDGLRVLGKPLFDVVAEARDVRRSDFGVLRILRVLRALRVLSPLRRSSLRASR